MSKNCSGGGIGYLKFSRRNRASARPPNLIELHFVLGLEPVRVVVDLEQKRVRDRHQRVHEIGGLADHALAVLGEREQELRGHLARAVLEVAVAAQAGDGGDHVGQKGFEEDGVAADECVERLEHLCCTRGKCARDGCTRVAMRKGWSARSGEWACMTINKATRDLSKRKTKPKKKKKKKH